MKNVIPLGILLFVLMLTACGDRTANLTNGVSTVSLNAPTPVAPSSPPASTSISSPTATKVNLEKEDDSIRAIGTHSDGRLHVKPASKASIAPLGAPSCLGLETDFRWSGDYEVLWESKSEGTPTKVMTFPIDFEIVQQNDSPVIMQQFTLEDTDIFAYVPRYNDCHGLETYLFGVSNGKAFPISFEIKPDEIWTNISQLPHHPLQVTNGEFIVIGGYGAGQDFVDVYHFRYDSKKKSMILKSTDHVSPNDIINDAGLINNAIQNNVFAKSQEKTIELEKAIQEKPTLYEQLQSAFYELDNRNPFTAKDNEFDITGFLDFTMNLFKEFLNSEQAYTASKSDYSKLSSLINVFPVDNGRIFTYSGTALLFGDSGKTDFAYFQTMVNGKIKVSVLYNNSFRDVLNIVQPSKDKNLIILTGRCRDGKPWRAFADGFYVQNGIASKTSILEDYTNEFWRVDPKEGTIFLIHSLSGETFINKTPGQIIEVGAGDAKLILSFNNKLSKYFVQRN